MDYQKTLEIAGIIVGLVGAGAIASWTIYSDELQSHKEIIASLEKSNKLNYPSFLAQINLASGALKENLDKLEKIEELQKTSSILEGENSKLIIELRDVKKVHNNKVTELAKELETQKNKLETTITNLNKEIAHFRASSTLFELMPGSGTSLKKGQVQVGFTKRNLDDTCKITVNNKRYDLDAGASIEVSAAGKQCKVVLNKCSISSFKPSLFELICL